MKRLHVHISVDSLIDSIGFYSVLFGAKPSVEKEDYAKWRLEDPLVNFAISKRSKEVGINHLGIEVDSKAELDEIATRIASIPSTFEEKDAACCYSHSDKHWTYDPQGIAWENFNTHYSLETFGEDVVSIAEQKDKACCIPLNNAAASEDSACCVPNAKSSSGCCA